MPEFAWVELDWELQRELWAEFATEFGFRRGPDPASWPAIKEPASSVCWALGPAPMQPVAQLVCDVLRACTEYWDSVFSHDSAHPSTQYRPHRVTDITDLDGWEYTHYPNGDYLIFVSKDLSFGVVGDHHEKSLCFFGETAVRAAIELNRGILGPLLRRDGQRVNSGSTTEQ
ncbi:DUF2716 domain-containing protein [Amycolatopsis sp. DSM 110486]|uniref:DUF2716 domain-containing protein n=1 Tax=Amycolatopsis sp. DSM 110486 TaxID=2865832 RepID=UPI001C69F104|nr:DUF2716 domain-containing protein [Amycolatopsis sp. DSM 110486]QYN18385.1 DUF2716 domain-containing protein [Amycolatopsis sp. DSM 110486]